ncbi:amidase family protein [Streptomyces sp. NBC_00009]|uniref:amidase family protein n=1 Tax=Streptomyces sp. NBC_00009 TaxID=2975620 RepID=UPI00324FF7E1
MSDVPSQSAVDQSRALAAGEISSRELVELYLRRGRRSAGAVIMGKSNMPPGNQDVQADNAVFGPSLNPWDTTRTSGGSAGGGAVVTAAGLAAFDFGSDIGGSTRIPAHFNGLYGHKSTWRSVPLSGHVPYGPGMGWWTDADMACGGAQVRDARDLVPILRAAAGTADHDAGFSYMLAPPRATKLSDFRVAVWGEDPSCPVGSDVAAAVDDAVTALRAADVKVTIRPASLPVDIASNHPPTAAPAHHNKLIDRFGRPYEVDGVRRPYWDQIKWNAVANVSGGPATTIPVRKGRNGLPIGLQAMGPSGGDLTIIECAALLSREVEGFVPPPAFA